MVAIDIHNFTKHFGSFIATNNINLQVAEGEIFGFIGPNGAGKSTTIRSLLNFIYPSSGSLTIFGHDCITASSEIKKFTGYVPSEVRYYNNVKVKDLLSYAMSFHTNADSNKLKRLCDLFEVDNHKKMKELSLGNKKKVAVIQALIHHPKLIILDEPTNGLDPLMQSRLLEVLSEENKNGATIFFSSHNLSEVQNFCKKVAVIKNGKIVDVKDLTSAIDAIIRIKVTSHNSIEEKDIPGTIKRFEKTANEYTIELTGDIDPVIKQLAKYNIEHVEISKLGIEETFISYYN